MRWSHQVLEAVQQPEIMLMVEQDFSLILF